MKEKKVRQLINDNDVRVVPKGSKSIYGKIIYYIFGVALSLTFLFPIFYMVACSTKSEETIAKHAGTLLMFIPDFGHFDKLLENYRVLFGDYNVGRYALNSFVYALVVIVLNILINGLAAYAISKLTFPGKKFFNFIIMFLIIVPVETSIVPLFTICQTMLGLTKNLSVRIL